MFEPTSRYHGLAVKKWTFEVPGRDPREIRYVERRFLPPLGQGTALSEHRVIQGDRLDLIAARHFGDPTQFWRIADANDGLRSEELTAQAGRRLLIVLSHSL